MLGNHGKLVVLTVVTVLGAVATMSYQLDRSQQQRLREALRSRAEAIARTVHEVRRSDLGTGTAASMQVQQTLCEGLSTLDDVIYVELFDSTGRIVAHSQIERVGERASPHHQAVVQRIYQGAPPIEEWDDARQAFNYFMPVGPPNPDGSIAGVVELVLDTRGIARTVAADSQRRLHMFLLVATVVLGILLVGARRIAASEGARRQAEDSARSLGEIVEGSVNEVYVFDAETLRFENVNAGARANIGYSMDELAELTPLDLKPALTAPEFEALTAPLRSGRTDIIQFDTYHLRKDGSTYPVQVNLSLSTRGRRPTFCAIILDQTEHQRAERQLRQVQKMEAVGQLSAGIAHDFNNMLTVIEGSLDLIRARNHDAQIDEMLDDIDSAAQRAAALTRQLVAFARRQPSLPVALDINARIDALMPMLRRLIREDVVIEFEGGSDNSVLMMDPSHLEQVITNLVINAQDAMAEGGCLTLSTSAATVEGPDSARFGELETGEYVVLTVRDTGHGIPDAERERVFEPFFTTKAPGMGSGLGLSTVHGIVEQAGGTILLDSWVGLGTEVRVVLPASAQQEERPPPVVDSVREPVAGKERILVCEDEGQVRKLVCSALEASGYAVVEARDAEMALDLLRSGRRVDLLLTDMVMPGMSGSELAKQVQSLLPEVALLFMSGHAPPQIAGADRPWRASDVLKKPFSTRELLSRVRQSLDVAQGANPA